MEILIFALVFWVAPFFAAYAVGKNKNRLGLAWGLLGWLGVLVLAFLPVKRKRELRRPSDGDEPREPSIGPL